MKLEQQTDGTYLASQHFDNKLRLSEGRTSDEASHGLSEMIAAEYEKLLEQMKREEAA